MDLDKYIINAIATNKIISTQLVAIYSKNKTPKLVEQLIYCQLIIAKLILDLHLIKTSSKTGQESDDRLHKILAECVGAQKSLIRISKKDNRLDLAAKGEKCLKYLQKIFNNS